ncbi:hypothetical protein [Salidesulfovibrio brasiliensis]|uniref:hypothetical protein n=1 Tax=Salidesulfovibrio brasiliensis TaxID=221711 RepID=UPI000ADAB36F|nr:hypothetical protein [Salidesulfovibrio brasiliensis]
MMMFMENKIAYWRELLLMLVMAAVILTDVFVLDSFHYEPLQPSQQVAEETASTNGGIR